MSFADSMDDLEAMNDPRNTAESMAAQRSAAKPGVMERIFGWMRLEAQADARQSPAPLEPTPSVDDAVLAEQQVTTDLDKAMSAGAAAAPAVNKKVS